MLFSLTMFPIGHGSSLTEPVADVIGEIERAGLRYQVTGMDTVIEGEWGDVLPVVQRAEERMRKRYGRVYMTLSIDDRVGASDRLQGAVADVEVALGHKVAQPELLF
jgi:uncharacterized protein (TIGR00106 family)